MARIQVGLDEKGLPIAWDQKIVYTTRNGRDGGALNGANRLPYAIPHFRLMSAEVEIPVGIGTWRANGHGLNAFFVESALDEIARSGHLDPLALRRKLLRDEPRPLAVLEAAAKAAKWGRKGQGIALWTCFGTVVAQVVELSVQDRALKVERVVCAVDCGQVVNPRELEAQVQGAVCHGLNDALLSQVTLQKGAVAQSDFHDYPLLRMGQLPPVQVVSVASDEMPGGGGDPGHPPVAPALTSALFSLTGQRVRELPLAAQGWKLA